MSAQYIYNNTATFIINSIKNNAQHLNDFIQSNRFDDDQEEIFRQLILTDGTYTCHNNMVDDSNQLIQKRVQQQKQRAQKLVKKDKQLQKQSEQKQSEQKKKSSQKPQIDIKKYHPKLRKLSCLQNPTNGVISKRHQDLADWMNQNIDLDKISNTDFDSVASKLSKIISDLKFVNDRMKLKNMANIQTFNIKQTIESYRGTTEITHKIDEICDKFIEFDKEYKNCSQKLDEMQKYINDVIVKLDLGIVYIDHGKKKIKPNLSCNKYVYKSGNVKAVIKGEQMFNFLKEKKKEINKLKNRLNSDLKKIQKDRANKQYLKYMKKKRKGKTMSEKDRSLRYKNSSAKKYQNQIKNGKKCLKKNKPKQNNSNSNAKLIDAKQLKIQSFFKPNNKNQNKNKPTLQISRDIYSFDTRRYVPNIKPTDFPLEIRLLINGYIRLNTHNQLPILLKLFMLCYYCYGLKDKCEDCSDVGAICSKNKCVRFVCGKCKCSHQKK